MKTKKKSSAFLTSLLALALSFAMMLGTTLAWFTDTASTSVNTIQAGTLDVELEMLDPTTGGWVSAQDKTLNWVRSTSTGSEYVDSEEILWEPGCTYKLQQVKVVNKGNLALKYKLAVTGMKGSAKLNEAIDWTFTIDGDEIPMNSGEYFLLPPVGSTESSDTITIQGHMREDAGNDYKKLSIEDISITVYATQYTNESDSFGDQYDKNAMYAALAKPVNIRKEVPVTIGADGMISKGQLQGKLFGEVRGGMKLYENADKTGLLTSQAGTLEQKVITSSTGDRVVYNILFTFTPDGGSPIEVKSTDGKIGYTFDVSNRLENTAVTHNGEGPTNSHYGFSSFGYTDNYNGSYQNATASGKLAITTYDCGEFVFTFTYKFEAVTAHQGYMKFEEAIEAAEPGATVVLLDHINRTAPIFLNKSVVLDLGGKTMANTSTNQTSFTIADHVTCTIRNGTIRTNTVDIANSATITLLEDLQLFNGASVQPAIDNKGSIGTINNVIADSFLKNYSQIGTVKDSKFTGLDDRGTIGTIENTYIDGQLINR